MTTTAIPTPPEPQAPPRPQYMTTFDGMASGRFPDAVCAVLLAPVDEREVEIRYDGIVYMPGVWYRRQLGKAFGPGAFSLPPRGPARTTGDSKNYHGALFVHVPGEPKPRFVAEAVGGCKQNGGMTDADAYEGAKTDCLSKCCKELLMAMELWDPAWRDSFLSRWGTSWETPKGVRWKKLDKPVAGRAAPSGRTGEAVTASVEASVATPAAKKRTVTGSDVPVATTVVIKKAVTPSAPKTEAAAPAASPAPSTPKPPAPTPSPSTTPTTTVATPTSGSTTSDAEPERVSADVIGQIRAAVGPTGWPIAKAREWLSARFGVTTPIDLSPQQGSDALALLMSAADPVQDAYLALETSLRADGRIR